MTAIRDQIFAKIEERFAALASPKVAEVQRMPSGEPTRFPALHIHDQGHAPALEEEETDTAAYQLQIGVDGFVQGADAHQAAHALYTAVIKTLFTEPVLDGLAQEIREGRLDMETAVRARDQRLGFGLEIEILFQTRRGVPDQIG